MIAVGGDCLFIAVVTDAGKVYEFDPRLVSAVAPLTKKVKYGDFIESEENEAGSRQYRVLNNAATTSLSIPPISWRRKTTDLR